MLKKIALGVLAAVVLLIVFIATGPATFRVERSTTIAAPAGQVFALLNDLHQWEKWNPYMKLDPTQTLTYGGPAAGVGASYAWKGEKSNEGRAEILESRSPDFLKIQLDFIAPMKATNITEYTLKPVAGGVSLTWAMYGDNSFLGKAVARFASMDSILGKDFDRGLADIKALAEAEAAREAPPTTAPVAAPAVP